MKKKLAIVFLCTAITLSFTGCSFIDGVKDGMKGKEANNKLESNKDEISKVNVDLDNFYL